MSRETTNHIQKSITSPPHFSHSPMQFKVRQAVPSECTQFLPFDWLVEFTHHY